MNQTENILKYLIRFHATLFHNNNIDYETWSLCERNYLLSENKTFLIVNDFDAVNTNINDLYSHISNTNQTSYYIMSTKNVICFNYVNNEIIIDEIGYVAWDRNRKLKQLMK